jgi:dTDP-4-amino-4,6-dideoxygalactose transaminase
MVDLVAQSRRIAGELDKAIKGVLDSTSFIKGPQVDEFVENLSLYLGNGRVIGCANGTDALQVALMALDLKPGDEIITSPFTFVATVEVIRLLGLKPVFADVDPDNFNLLPEEIEKKVTSKTRAIMPVHLFGQCAHMDDINRIASLDKLYVIEDAAQALGTDYYHEDGSCRKAGTIGHIGCTSFFPSKNLGAFGDGGAIFTNDLLLGEKIAALTNHGMKTRYYYDYVGVNSRLDTLQAAILNVKLKYLDEYNEARKKAASLYDHLLSGIEEIRIPARTSWSDHTFHQYTLRVTGVDRDKLKAFLATRGIPSMVYYPVGLHLQKAYADLGYQQGDFPVTELLSGQVLSLPMHTELDSEQIGYICDTIKEFMQQKND